MTFTVLVFFTLCYYSETKAELWPISEEVNSLDIYWLGKKQVINASLGSSTHTHTLQVEHAH